MMAIALLIVCLLVIFSRAPRSARLAPAQRELAIVAAKPLVSRLSSWRWTREEVASIGLRLPAAQIFWAEQLGWIEYRSRPFRGGMWLRLTPAGACLA